MLTLENDEDYTAVQCVAPGLQPLRTRMWHHLLLSPDARGNLKAGLAFIWMMLLAALVFAAWQSVSR